MYICHVLYVMFVGVGVGGGGLRCRGIIAMWGGGGYIVNGLSSVRLFS